MRGWKNVIETFDKINNKKSWKKMLCSFYVVTEPAPPDLLFLRSTLSLTSDE